MLPLNRVYTPQELRVASRLTPTRASEPVVDHRLESLTARPGRRPGLAALWQRLSARAGVRRSAPSAT